jgi:hypothetical protein
MKFHVFHTDNMPTHEWGAKIISDQKKVADHVGIEIEYVTAPYIDFKSAGDDHGRMVTEVIRDSEGVICFLDLDCLPYDLTTLQNIYDWVDEHKSFAGNAQNISHIPESREQIFAAPSMLMVHKEAWLKLGSPDMAQQHRESDGQVYVDVAQQLTINAKEQGFVHATLLPLGCDYVRWSTPIPGGPDFSLGAGTKYPGSWHYFQGSINVADDKLWDLRVSEILDNKEIVPYVNF